MPSSRARWFMSRTKAASLPPRWMASASAASLAEEMAVACKRSRTLTRSPGRRRTREPPTVRTSEGTVTVSSKDTSSRSSASSMISSVIILARLAGARSWSGSFEKRTFPVSASTT